MPCKDCFCLSFSFLDTVKWATHSTTRFHPNIYHRPQAARDQPAWTETPKLWWNKPSYLWVDELRSVCSACMICGWQEHTCPLIPSEAASQKNKRIINHIIYLLTWSGKTLDCWFQGSCQTLKWLRILLNPHSIPKLQVMNLSLNKDLVQDHVLMRSVRLVTLTQNTRSLF